MCSPASARFARFAGVQEGIRRRTRRPATSFTLSCFLLHWRSNSSKLEPFRWVVVRSTATPIVVNFPNDNLAVSPMSSYGQQGNYRP